MGSRPAQKCWTVRFPSRRGKLRRTNLLKGTSAYFLDRIVRFLPQVQERAGNPAWVLPPKGGGLQQAASLLGRHRCGVHCLVQGHQGKPGESSCCEGTETWPCGLDIKAEQISQAIWTQVPLGGSHGPHQAAVFHHLHP